MPLFTLLLSLSLIRRGRRRCQGTRPKASGGPPYAGSHDETGTFHSSGFPPISYPVQIGTGPVNGAPQRDGVYA